MATWAAFTFILLFVEKLFLEHIQELKYEDKPDYDLLMDVFRSSMQRKMVKESDAFDWEKENSEEDASVNALATTLALAGITTRADVAQNNTTQPINSTTKPIHNVPPTPVTTQQQTSAGAALATSLPAVVPNHYQTTVSSNQKEAELNNNIILDYSNRNDSNYGNESLKKQMSLIQKSGENNKIQQNVVAKRSSTVDQQRLNGDNSQSSLQQQRKSRVPIEANNMKPNYISISKSSLYKNLPT